MGQLDRYDIKILKILQENSRLTTKEIASKINLTTTPVFERIKRLERNGFIKGYTAVLDIEKLNMGFVVFCCVKLKTLNRDIALNFVESMKNVPEVTECYNISGEYDYMLKVNVADMKQYQEFVLNTLGTVDSLRSITSMFVMETIKNELSLYPEIIET